MQQRLCLAHALVHDPQVLLLDEPASGLDPRARVELRELLRELRSLGKTILISSHILPELEELCTSVAIVDRGQVLAQGRVVGHRAATALRRGPAGPPPARGRGPRGRRDSGSPSDADVATAVLLEDGTIELGFRGDDAASARLLAESVAAGLPIVSFARAASDLEELFLQVTVPGSRTAGSGVGARHDRTDRDGRDRRPPPSCRNRRRFTTFARTAGGIAAIGVKELRGRMRGRRAFAILTIYLLLLGGFALMAERLVESNYTSGFGGSSAFAGAAIGQGIFAALLMLMTLQVVFLAPSSTSGSISLEREKQTLELLIATPDQLARDRRRQAALGPRLRLPADRRVDPADGGRVRVRRRRTRGRPARLHRPDRCRPRARVVRPPVLEPRQANDGRDGDHDLRRARDHGRDDLRPRVLAGHGPVRRQGQSRGAVRHPLAGDPRLPEPVRRPGRRHVRHGDDASAVAGAAP